MAGSEDIMGASEEVQQECPSDTITHWKLDQLHEKLDRLTIPVRDAVHAAMAGLRGAMNTRAPDRGPDPDAPDENEERILIPVRLLDRIGNNYQEAPKAPQKDTSLKAVMAVIIGCTISIVSSGIVGGIILANQFAALHAEFSEWKTATNHRLEQLERHP